MNKSILQTATTKSTTITGATWSIEVCGVFDAKTPVGGPVACAYRILGPGGVDLRASKGFPARPGNSANMPPWRALRAALERLGTLCAETGAGVASLEVRADAQLLCNQLAGRWECRSPRLVDRLAHCLKLLSDLGLSRLEGDSPDVPWWRVEWVRKSENRVAHELARAAFFGAAGYLPATSWRSA